MSIVVRVGLGQTPSGKILDRGTQWYNGERKNEIENALNYAVTTHREMFVSYNNKKYIPLSNKQMQRLYNQLK